MEKTVNNKYIEFIKEFDKFISANFKKSAEYYADTHISMQFRRNPQDDTNKSIIVYAYGETNDALRFVNAHVFDLSWDEYCDMPDETLSLYNDMLDRHFAASGDASRKLVGYMIGRDKFDLNINVQVGDLNSAIIAGTQGFTVECAEGNEYGHPVCAYFDKDAAGNNVVQFRQFRDNGVKTITELPVKAMMSKLWTIIKPLNPLTTSDERYLNKILASPACKGVDEVRIASEYADGKRLVTIVCVDKGNRLVMESHQTFKSGGQFQAFCDFCRMDYTVVKGKVGKLIKQYYEHH